MKLKGFQKLTLTDQAQQTWFGALKIGKPKMTQVPLRQALNRVLAEDLFAQRIFAPFRQVCHGWLRCEVC